MDENEKLSDSEINDRMIKFYKQMIEEQTYLLKINGGSNEAIEEALNHSKKGLYEYELKKNGLLTPGEEMDLEISKFLKEHKKSKQHL